MYAVVNIAGQQFKVSKDQQIFVHRLESKEGDKVQFDEVLLVDDNGKISVGAPAVEGAQVSAKVLEHLKGDKVIVFKKKRRKGYQTRNGHRQQFTKIAIEGISLGKAGKAAAKKEESKPEPKAKAEAAKEVKPAAKATKAAAPAKPEPKAKAEAAPVKKEATKAAKAEEPTSKTEKKDAPKGDQSAQ